MQLRPGQPGYPVGAPGGVTPPKGKGKGLGSKIGNPRFIIFLILFAVIPTIVWTFQLDNLLDLLGELGKALPLPGFGELLFRWLPMIMFFLFGWLRASNYSEPQPPYFLHPPPMGRAIVELIIFYLFTIFIPIFIVKPLITAGVESLLAIPQVKQFISGWNSIAEQVSFLPKIDVPGEKEKTKEEIACGTDEQGNVKYRKLDEEGNVIESGKPISVGIQAPAWPLRGEFYKLTVKIKLDENVKKPLNVIIAPGKSLDSEKTEDGNEIINLDAEGSFIKGETDKKIKDIKKPIAFNLLTPLGCLPPNGCLIEPGPSGEKTVDLITTKKIEFKSGIKAEVNIEAKIRYDKEDKKGVGIGTLLIFKDSKDAVAKQQDPNFKNNNCPNTFSGPLDVVVIPPFYTVGDESEGGDGYFVDSGGLCEKLPETLFSSTGGYCIHNVKDVKVRLINKDEKDAKIEVKSVKIFPFKTPEGTFPKEYTNLVKGILPFLGGNCFLESLGPSAKNILFKDEEGTLGSIKKVEDLAPRILKEHTYICRYQINDFPPSLRSQEKVDTEGIIEFRAYQFKAEVEYNYVATFVKANIPMSTETIGKVEEGEQPLGSTSECPRDISGGCTIDKLKDTCFGSNAPKASAICNKESGGDPLKPSGTDRCKDGTVYSHGLFQINVIAHAEKIGGDCVGLFETDGGSLGSCLEWATTTQGIRYCKLRNCWVKDADMDRYARCVQRIDEIDRNIDIACQISSNGADWGVWGANDICKFPAPQ